jgi:hypothetical protein
VALMVLLLVSLGLALVASALARGMRIVRQEAEGIQLAALSDAAVAETLARLDQDPSFRGVAEHTYGGGLLSSEVVDVGAKRWWVTARAVYGRHRRAVRVEVHQLDDGRVLVSGWREVR